ncbi:hypothetical protein A6R68_18257, partial [Neotoma lepida]
MSFVNSVALLTINEASAEDSGDYICEAHNGVGDASCSTALKVKEPPRFVKKLSDMSTLIGDPVELQAVVEGFQPISVVWLKDK